MHGTNTRPWLPGLTLFLLSPAIGELLSTSMPPTEFFSPFCVFVLVLYGGGALLCRELAFRWSKGWPSLLVLGAAYGIVEEGLMVKSFFNPNWMDIANPEYGRWAAVNWVWSLNLTIYHAVVSIAIPILLVGLLFPDRRRVSWASGKTLAAAAVLLAADVAFGCAFFGDGAGDTSPYRPPLVPYLLAMALTGALAGVAKALPSHPGSASDNPPPVRPRAALHFGAGLAGAIGLFAVPSIACEAGLPAAAAMALTVGFYALLAAVILRGAHGAPLKDSGQLALASGVLSLFILFNVLSELRVAPRQDDPRGCIMVALGFSLLLLWLRSRVRQADCRA